MNATCEVCDGPLRADNRYGICNKTLECRRKKGLVKYYRYHDSQQERALEYFRENRDELNRKHRERYASSVHAEITYLAWSPGLRLLKIGITSNLKIRFKALRNACPDVVILASIPCGRELERYLHAALASKLRSGEWFDLGSDPVSAVLEVLKEVFSFIEEERP